MRLPFICLFLVIFSSSFGETPETIYPKTKILRPTEWYLNQAVLWKEQSSKAPHDAHAWFNYYIASKYSLQDKEALSLIAQNAETAISGTFENHLIQAINTGFTAEDF